jgi:hypothetical protein
VVPGVRLQALRGADTLRETDKLHEELPFLQVNSARPADDGRAMIQLNGDSKSSQCEQDHCRARKPRFVCIPIHRINEEARWTGMNGIDDGRCIVVIGAGYASLPAAGREEHRPPLAHGLRGRNVTHIRARVTELDLARAQGPPRRVEALDYDTLVYALFSRTTRNNVPEARERTHSMERPEELRELPRRRP